MKMRYTESNNRSTKIRNYSIAGFFIVVSVLIVGTVFGMIVWGFGTAANIWSQCGSEAANVFIGANDNLRNVKCIALDKEFFVDPEIFIGDLSKNDEDVCRFRLIKNTTEPLRFEVQYNNKVEREVCEWQHSGILTD